jgi:hypothetical protein
MKSLEIVGGAEAFNGIIFFQYLKSHHLLPLFYVPTRFNWFFVLALIHTPFIESI